MTYTIFDHAQLGHVPEKREKPNPPKPLRQSCRCCSEARGGVHFQWCPDYKKPRKSKPRGWAVEAGLGLGPQFKDKRFP